MTTINNVNFGPILKLNSDLGIKITEDGRASLKVLTPTDMIFFSQTEEGKVPLVSFNFFEDGTELPIQNAKVKTNPLKEFTIETKEGQTSLKRQSQGLTKANYEINSPTVGKTTIDRTGVNYAIQTSNQKLSVNRYVNMTNAGYEIQTPNGTYDVEKSSKSPNYVINTPKGQQISVSERNLSLTAGYVVDMPYNQQFTLDSDILGNWTVRTPSGNTVKLKRYIRNPFDFMGNSMEIHTAYGKSRVTASGIGKFQLTPLTTDSTLKGKITK